MRECQFIEILPVLQLKFHGIKSSMEISLFYIFINLNNFNTADQKLTADNMEIRIRRCNILEFFDVTEKFPFYIHYLL